MGAEALTKWLVRASFPLQDGLWSSMPSSSTDLGGVYIAIHGSRQSGGYRWADVREMCRKYLQRASSGLVERRELRTEAIASRMELRMEAV